MPTRVEIYPDVIHRLGLPSTDKRVSTDHVYRSINNALLKMARDFNWPWLVNTETFTLSSGTNSHTPPADWSRTLWIADLTRGFEIRNTQRRAMLRWSSVVGYSRYFSTEGGILTFSPTANLDMSLTHTYISKESVLSDDSDETLCPPEMIDVVCVYAAIEEATRLKDAVLRGSLMDELKDIKKSAEDAARKALPNLVVRNKTRWWLGR